MKAIHPPRACPLCKEVKHIASGDELAAALPDRFPLNDGHTLVVPVRHEADLFALSEAEHLAIWRLVKEIRAKLAASHGFDSFNIGVNCGALAGQTLEHAHIHVIPRVEGDVVEPRGGIRWVIPQRADYWTART